MRTTPGTEHQAALFGSVFLLAQYLARRADEALAPLGLTTRQWLLLAVLVKRFPGARPTLTEAAAAYGSSRQNVKQIAVQLAARGWLTMAPDAEDRRALRLALTAKVAEFDAPAARRRQRDFLAQACAAFGPSETARLLELIERWLAALQPR